MAEDLMSTQTGGYGETIQSAPETIPTPEQFNVQLPPSETQQPPSEPQVQADQPPQPEPTEPPVNQVTDQVDVEQTDVPQEPPVNQPITDPSTQNVEPAPIVVTSTIDGEMIFDPASLQKQEEKKPLDFNDQLEYTEKGPSSTEDGEVIMNFDAESDDESLNEVYSGSTVKLKGSRVFSIKQDGDPDKPKKPKRDGFYKYPGQPDSIYEKRDGDWYKSTDGGDNYFKISKGDVEKRAAILEAEAIKFVDPKKSTAKLLQSTQGNLGKFNLPNSMVTAGGNPLVSKNIQFSDFTKSNVGSETDRYNKDGTLNFNYNREVAQMAPENKAIYQASKNEKPDGIYRFPGREDALYKKEGKNWYIDLSNTGDKFEWINTETPKGKERVGNLQAQAVPATTYAQLKLMQIDTSKLGTTDGLLDLLDVGEEIGKINEITQSDQLKTIFEQGQNFVDTEIMNFAKDNLTKDQKENLVILQGEINQIIGDGSYSDLKAKKIAELLSDGEQFFEDAVATNDKVNKAYSAGISLDRLTYENKKKTFAQDFDQKTMSDADMYAAKLFQDVRWMSDFVIENVDAGNLKINPQTGAIEFTEGASPAERKYIDGRLSELLKRYEGIQDQRFAEVKDQILSDKSEMSDIKVNIDLLNDQLAEARKTGDYAWASQISGVIKSEKQKMSALQKKINDSENLSNTLFLTNPKKIIDNVAGLQTNSSKAAFESIPKGLSPKQRFDLYYEALQKKNQQIAERNNIDYKSLDRFDMRLKDLLDWGEFYSLSKAEQEYLKNKATINALRPLYYNNDTGFTGATTGFWESFVNGYAKALQPKTSAADGYQSTADKAELISRFIEDEGFNEDDVVTPDAIEKIKEKSVVDFWSRESFGSMTGTSGAYMQMIMLASEAPGVALRGISSAEKLITGAKTITDAEKYAKGLVDAYDAAMSTTKLGRFLKPVIKEGVNFEIAGNLFNDPDNQLNFVSGAAGGALGEGVSVLANKMGSSKLGNYVSGIFGDQSDEAFKVLERVGRLSARGFGEVPQETAEELANIYMNSSNFEEMMSKASESFGSFDKIQQFVISSFILGSAFGAASTLSAKKAYETMPEDKRRQVDQVLSQLKSDINKGQQAANNYAETMNQREDVKEKVDKDDKENKPGVSSEERVGEELVKEQPVAETSEETISPSGVVQEEQVKVEEVTPEQEIVAETNAPLEPSESDMFNDLQSIGEIKNPAEKRRAIDEFNAKYDGQYKRMSKIDTNFGSIVRNLKKNNLINIDC
jgi:hypothetical protein